jgi:hypothetical protein
VYAQVPFWALVPLVVPVNTPPPAGTVMILPGQMPTCANAGAESRHASKATVALNHLIFIPEPPFYSARAIHQIQLFRSAF